VPVVFLHPVIVCKERAESWLSLDDKREGGQGTFNTAAAAR